jgi:2,3,4,5-tetrahydropyridine-2-carboxylate N-succinyltransferase
LAEYKVEFLMNELIQSIEEAWENRALLNENATIASIEFAIEELDKGRLRVAEKVDGLWKVNAWLKKAVILYFPIRKMKTSHAGVLEFNDKMELKRNYQQLGIRVVPHAVSRYGAYLAPGVVMMPSYVNIGAYIDSGTMVDTWATVGSCAQIGKNVHLSGGVGIGGVLEPVQASPVIIEDNCFIGSRCVVVEGVRIEEEAVLGANVVLTKSTRIIDVRGSEPVEMKGTVPRRSVVIPGTMPKRFPAGTFQVPCALIIGERKASTDLKTSLNSALRDFEVAV